MLKHTLLLPFFLIGALLQAQTTVVDVVVNSDDHTLLEAAVSRQTLAGALSGDGPFTVFAPTDDAITALVTELGITADDLLALEGLGDILTLPRGGRDGLSTDLMDGDMFTTLLGADVTISIMDGTVMVNNATVTVADITTDNGVVHVIDAVLLPPTPETTTVVDVIVNSEDHTLLEAAVGAAGLVEALSGEGPFTVFAPTDDADDCFGDSNSASLPKTSSPSKAWGHPDSTTWWAPRPLSTDLMDGDMFTTMLGEDVTISIMDGTVMVNNATVTVADITTDNGVVHVIDAVLLPPTPETTTVVDVIVNSEDHTLLEAAVGAAGLVEALSGEGPFTVFAPTDDADDCFGDSNSASLPKTSSPSKAWETS